MTNQPNPKTPFFAALNSAVLHAEERDQLKAIQAFELARGMNDMSDDLSRAHWMLCAAKIATAFHHANGWDWSVRAFQEFGKLGLTTEMEQCTLLFELNHYVKFKLETPEKTFQLLNDLHEIRKTLRTREVEFTFDYDAELAVFCAETKEQMTAFFNKAEVKALLPLGFVLEGSNRNRLDWNETPHGVTIYSQGSSVSISRVNDGLGHVYESGSFLWKNSTLEIHVLDVHTQEPMMLEFENVESSDVKAVMDCLSKK